MRFDSAEFLLFFAVVLVLHRLGPRSRLLLLVASYGFYASWNPPFLLLLVFSTLLDYTVGRRIAASRSDRRRRLWLFTSLAGNLGVLAYFKYVNFALDSLASAGLADPATLSPLRVHAEIPLGISFYTFQTLSYTIDVYRGQVEPCRRPLDFALYVAFFPQLLAGPIMRAAELLPQIRARAAASTRQVLEGIELCGVGLFKKVVVADNFALLVDACFADPERYSGAALVVGVFAFSAQIYCDFSGYSTLARGLGKLMGFELPDNFGYPLLAGDPIEYRRSWHITMGRWFSDYLYRPLGGDRVGLARMAFNTLLTWAAFGLWHGASWSFVLWGLFNGALLTAYRLGRTLGWLPTGRLASGLGIVAMPVFIALANVLFRAPDLATAGRIFARIGSLADGAAIAPFWAPALLAALAAHALSRRWYREDFLARAGWTARVLAIAGLLASLLLFAGSGEPFYYFRF